MPNYDILQDLTAQNNNLTTELVHIVKHFESEGATVNKRLRLVNGTTVSTDNLVHTGTT